MITQQPAPGAPQRPTFPMIELPPMVKSIADMAAFPPELIKYFVDTLFDASIHLIKWETEPAISTLTAPAAAITGGFGQQMGPRVGTSPGGIVRR